MMQAATQQPSSIILSLPKERCPAGASKDGGCGLGAGVRGRCFEGAARHLSMRLEGEVTGYIASCQKSSAP